jgi:hypothetical protein
MDCKVVSTFNHTSRIRSLAVSTFVDDDAYNIFYSIVFDGDNDKVFVFNYNTKKLIAEITYQADFEG